MKRLFLYVLISMGMQVGSASAMDDLVFCLSVIRIAEQHPEGLEQYDRQQILNGLCLSNKAAYEAINTGNEYLEEQCLQATIYLFEVAILKHLDPRKAVGICS